MKIITYSFILFCCIGFSETNAQCDNSANIASVKVYKESFSTAGFIESIPAGLVLIPDDDPTTNNGYFLCSPYASMNEDEDDQVFSLNIDATTTDEESTEDEISAARQAMVYYHITEARNFAYESLSSGLTTALDGSLDFTVEDIGKALIMVDKPDDNVNVDYRKRDSASEGGSPYKAFAEDAFAIASGYFQAAHINSLVGTVDSDEKKLPSNEGVQYAISDYLAYRYMSSKGYSTGTTMYVHAGVDSYDWSTLNIDFAAINYEYDSDDFLENKSSQEQSELLSATLYHLTALLNADGNGKAKVDAMVVNAMVDMNNSTIENGQGDAAKILYSQAVANGLDELDLCIILYFFTEVYGFAFFEEGNTYIPSSSDGEIYIKDNAAHTGTEVTTGSYTNSPSIWNRHDENDFTPEHQNPYGGGAPTTTQYINIAIDGSFCDIQGLINIVGDVHYKIYRSVPKLGYEWPLDWDDENVHNAPEGDLIGTFYVKDPDNGNLSTYRDDQGQIVTGWNFSNEGNLLILSFPWEVPDYLYDIWLPNISPKDNSGLGFSFQDAFLVRVESSQYDPIANGEVANVYANVQNNNNIAMKTSNITIVYEQGSTGSTPGFLLPNDDDDPGDVVISVNPSTHDPVRPVHPDPTDPDGPFVPIHPEFNNYMDYGEVRIVLDEDTHQDWIANGTQGNGFIVNGDNEIVVTRSDFTLEGIPRSVRGGQIRVMGVRYYAANGTFTSRTGFDVVAKNSAGNIIGSTHFEVREDSGSSVPRSSAGDNVNGDITIYPNPINGNTLHLDNITREGSYTIMGVDGKTHAQGRYSKAQKSLDISILNKGIYFIRFANDEGVTETKQLIINN